MTRLVGYKLLVVAALGTPAAFLGCRSRTDFVTEAAFPPPVRSVTTEETTVPDAEVPPVETSEEPDRSGVAPAPPEDETISEPGPVSLEDMTVRTPQDILKDAGAVLDYDKHERPVGVDLTNARLSEEVTRAVAELSELQWVDMRGARVTDADLAVIATLPRLELLALGDTLISDAGLKHLKQQQELRFLSLDGTAVTDAGLLSLAGLPRLEGISLSGTNVSRAGARRFEDLTPGSQVILDDSAPETSSEFEELESEPANDEATSKAAPVWDLEVDPGPEPLPQVAPSAPVSISNRTGDAGQTSVRLNRILQEKLLEPDVLEALGQHLLARKSYQKAAVALEALVALQPSNQQARFDLGVALARSGHFEAAQPHMASIVGDATAYFNLGVIAYEANRMEQSEWYFSRALALAPDFSEARQWMDRIYEPSLISPAGTPQPVDREDLVNLLMSELGSAIRPPLSAASEAGIEIVPASHREETQIPATGW